MSIKPLICAALISTLHLVGILQHVLHYSVCSDPDTYQ